VFLIFLISGEPLGLTVSRGTSTKLTPLRFLPEKVIWEKNLKNSAQSRVQLMSKTLIKGFESLFKAKFEALEVLIKNLKLYVAYL